MLLAIGELADIGDDVLEDVLRAKMVVPAKSGDQARLAEFFAVAVEGFGDAVRVERKGVAGADGVLADFAVPCFENAEDGSGRFEAINRVVGSEDERGQMAAIGVTKAAGGDVVVAIKKSGESAVGRVLREELIDGLKQPLRVIEKVRALAAKIGLKIRHQESRGDALAGDVADNQAETVGAEVKEVVVVAADRASRVAMAGVVEPADWRTNLREKAALDFVGDFELLGCPALGFELRGIGAAFGLQGVSDFVEADKVEDISVNVAKTRDNAAPNRGFGAQDLVLVWGLSRARVRIVFEAL